ncbi:MAG: hypothetical protein KDI50_03035 [Candidatus Competibacteraceae bacterium]|nr:hypothetical protein [Candidatus Competibacteraceae bacterium]
MITYIFIMAIPSIVMIIFLLFWALKNNKINIEFSPLMWFVVPVVMIFSVVGFGLGEWFIFKFIPEPLSSKVFFWFGAMIIGLPAALMLWLNEKLTDKSDKNSKKKNTKRPKAVDTIGKE